MKTQNKSIADLHKQPATKADIAKLETGLRKDMVAMETGVRKDMATKKDLNEVKQDVSALKTDMGSVKQSIGKLAVQTLKNTEDIEWIKENMVTKNDHNKVMTALDEVLRIVKKTDIEQTAVNARLERVEREKADKTEVVKIKAHIGMP